MAGTAVTPTRMVLNQLKGRLKTARRGHKLLKDKRDELMRQFMDVVKQNKVLRLRVEEGLTQAFASLQVASAIMSPEMLEQALSTGKYDLITITQNETSTGIHNPMAKLAEVYKKYPDVIVCVDAVSSMAGDLIPVDELGIDVCITSTQKCLGLPPGMAIASVSEKAIKKAETVENRGLYFDYLELVKFVKEKPYQYPSTPSESHMFALDYQLDKILEEGVENRYKRHCEMAKIAQDWAREHCELYSDPDNLSVTVTCVKNTTGKPFSEISKAMGERGYLMSNGYGPLKDITFRIAHMGDLSIEELQQYLKDLTEVIEA